MASSSVRQGRQCALCRIAFLRQLSAEVLDIHASYDLVHRSLGLIALRPLGTKMLDIRWAMFSSLRWPPGARDEDGL
jgi:hypothetical protein